MSAKILIADDHGVLRAGLRALLAAQPDFMVVGEAADGNETLRLATETTPDVLLLDITMPEPDGIAVCRQIRAQQPTLRVLMLTVYEDEALLREAIQAGADGYIVKRAVEAELITAIRAVQRGDLYIHPAMTRALIGQRSAEAQSGDPSPVEALTPRETDVLRLLALGYTNQQVADKLRISVRTVESHRANLTAKLGSSSRVDLVRYARERKLL